jgi:hypothetical protein
MERTSLMLAMVLGFMLLTITVCSAWTNRPASDTNINPYVNPDWFKETVYELGACKIQVLKEYFWRDWMPIVSRPGTDGGSPLYSKVTLSLDNSIGGSNKLSFQAVIVDNKGRSYPANFQSREWNGELKPGEIRTVELFDKDGPYLPVRDSVHVEMTLTDQKGDSIVVKTRGALIERTD